MATSDYYQVTLTATGKQYNIPTNGVTDWRNSLSLYLRDLATAVNEGGGGGGGGSAGVGINITTYGAVGNGVADCTTAFNEAIAAAVWSVGKRRAIYIPPGIYRVTAPIVVPASLGLMIYGEGPWASQILLDPTVSKDNGLVINSSQRVVLQDFAIVGKQSNPAGKALYFSYNPIVNATSGMVLRNIWITGQSLAVGAYDYGIYWSDDYGNNSEVTYDSVTIDCFSVNGVTLPGSQQYSHVFNRVDINGLWDGVSTSSPGGQCGIVAGEGTGPAAGSGTFHVFGGNISSCRKSAVVVTNPTAPCSLDGVLSEHCYRFLGDPGDAPISSAAGWKPIAIRDSRLDCALSAFDPAGYIQYAAMGTLVIENNAFNGGDGTQNGGGQAGQVRILLATGNAMRGVSIRGNRFLTLNSENYSPLNIQSSAVDLRTSIGLRENTYTDGVGNIAYRNEALDVAQTNTPVKQNDIQQRSEDIWYLDLTTLTANAASQTVALQADLERGIKFWDFYALVYNYAVHSGGASVYVKVGTTSGGDELLQEVLVSGASLGDTALMYGDADAEAGTGMLGGRGFMPNPATTTTVYATVRVSSGTVGNGTASNLTRGVMHFPLEYKIVPRLLT